MTTLDAELTDRLRIFEELLLKWNARINLVSARDTSQLWMRHILDSLRLRPLIPAGTRMIDLGSGGGFPGIILGIACGAEVALVESDARKCAFLREATRLCGVKAEVHCSRIEDLKLEAAPIVTARALAPLKRLLGWSQSLVAPDGVALFLKGRAINDELIEARRLWIFDADILDELASTEGVILKVRNIRKAG